MGITDLRLIGFLKRANTSKEKRYLMMVFVFWKFYVDVS